MRGYPVRRGRPLCSYRVVGGSYTVGGTNVKIVQVLCVLWDGGGDLWGPDLAADPKG